MIHLQRSEANAWWSFLTCTPWLILIAYLSYWLVEQGLDYLGILVFGVIIIAMIFQLWLPSKVLHRWYLEVSETGIVYNIFWWRRSQGWDEVVDVITEKSEGFTGNYDDTLVIATKDSLMSFFLHDFGLHTKKETNEFVDQVIQYYEQSQQ